MKSSLLASTAVSTLSTAAPATFSFAGTFVPYVVTQTGLYVITAEGGQGGNAQGTQDVGGFGAEVSASFELTQGETLEIAVGHAGFAASQTSRGHTNNAYGGGGGGGGSWVRVAAGALLEVAGGGGGAYGSAAGGGNGGNAPTSDKGTGAGGTSESGVYSGGGGGGAQSSGVAGNYTSDGSPGAGLAAGLMGASAQMSSEGTTGAGGFGGGGSGIAYNSNGGFGGGGGGYTGGNGYGAATSGQGGTGGTSYVNTTLGSGVSEVVSSLTGNGMVTITEQACFAAGTLIETDLGPVAVETLQPGDHVRLARENAFVPIVWLGHRTVDCVRHPRPDAVMPIRVRADAFGPGHPTRDLILSPDHAVFFDDALIPVRHLLNGATVLREPRASVTYWHVELERHDVLLAEGLPCESYLDTGNRTAFANAGPVVSAHPQFDPAHAMAVWAADACAPLVTNGVERDAAHDVLLANAAELGHEATDDPALALLVNGRLLRPGRVGALVRFEVPAGATSFRLLSRRFVPAQMRSGARDHRTLGAAITGLRIDGVDVPLDSLPVADGWLLPEADARTAWRWTDGDTELRSSGAQIIEVMTGPDGLYWRSPVIVPAQRACAA